MRHFVQLGIVAASLFALFACAEAPEPGSEESATDVEQAATNNSSGYVTRDVCIACGCRATDVACDCGLGGPSPKKQECLDNGGPKKKGSLGTVGVALDPSPAPVATFMR